MTYTGSSGLGRPVAGLQPETLRLKYPAQTTREMIFIDGQKQAGSALFINGVLTDYYTDYEVFRVPVSLSLGVNSIELKTINVLGIESATQTISITRIDWTADTRRIDWNLTIDGTDYSDYFTGFDVEGTSPYLARRYSFNLIGNLRKDLHPAIQRGKAVEFDCIINGFTVSYSGTISDISIDSGENGSFNTTIDAFNEGITAVDETLASERVRGYSNGKVLIELARALGFADDKILVPRGNVYTGPKSLAGSNYQTLINNICFAEMWNLDIDDGWFVISDKVFTNFASFTVTDNQLFQNSYKDSGGEYFNRLKGQKIVIEEELLAADLELLNIPEQSGEGMKLFTSQLFNEEADSYSPDDTMYIMIYSEQIDWSNLSRADLFFKFARVPGRDIDFEKTFSLITLPDRNIGVAIIPLDIYSLFANSEIFIKPIVFDNTGLSYYPDTYTRIALDDDLITEAKDYVTKFGFKFGPRQIVGSVSRSFRATPEEFPTRGYNNVQWSNVQQNGDQYLITWIEKIPFNTTDIPLASIVTDLDFATGKISDPAHLVNCEILTDGNVTVNYGKWWFAVDYHDPATPMKRIDGVYVKFKASVKEGQRVYYAFNIAGQTMTIPDNYIDPAEINFTYQTPGLIAGIETLVDGGIIQSAYFSTPKQVERAITVYGSAGANPPPSISASIPGLPELRSGELIRINSALDESDNYIYAYGVKFSLSIGDDGIPQTGTALSGYWLDDVDIPRTRGIDATETVWAVKAVGISPVDLAEAIALKPDTDSLVEGTILARRYRGSYSVEILGQKYTGVPSLLDDLESDDKVLVGELSRGAGFIILQKIEGTIPDYDDTVDDTTDSSGNAVESVRISSIFPKENSTIVPKTTEGMLRFWVSFNKNISKLVGKVGVYRGLTGQSIGNASVARAARTSDQFYLTLPSGVAARIFGGETIYLGFESSVTAFDGTTLAETTFLEYAVDDDYNPRKISSIVSYLGEGEQALIEDAVNNSDDPLESDDRYVRVNEIDGDSVNLSLLDENGNELNTADLTAGGAATSLENGQMEVSVSDVINGRAVVETDLIRNPDVVVLGAVPSELVPQTYDIPPYHVKCTALSESEQTATLEIYQLADMALLKTMNLDAGDLTRYARLEVGLQKVDDAKAYLVLRITDKATTFTATSIQASINEIVIEFNDEVDPVTAGEISRYVLEKSTG